MRNNKQVNPWLYPIIDGVEYTFYEKLSGGHQATTFIAENNARKFVIKYYYCKDGSISSDKLARAKKEIDILKGLPPKSCFPKYIGSLIQDKNIWIVMSYVQGDDLEKYLLKKEPNTEARLNIFKEILCAIKLLHEMKPEGYYHRDLKPGNILVRADGQVVIVDFGLSINANTEEHAISLMEKRIGPLFFQCPESEVVSSEFEKIPGARFDLYPLGKLLYFIIKFNKHNHGYFPREKNAQSPWRLTGKELLFQPVIASVVTGSSESASAKNINELITMFDKYYYIYMRNQNEGNLSDNLAAMILMDENVHRKIDIDSDKKITYKNFTNIISSVTKVIEQKIQKAIQSNAAFKINIGSIPYLPAGAAAFKRYGKNKNVVLSFSINYCDFYKTSIHILILKDEKAGEAVSLNILVCIFGINDFPDSIQVEYKPELKLDNTSILSKEDATVHIESWLYGFDTYIEKIIAENYEIWKQIYSKESSR